MNVHLWWCYNKKVKVHVHAHVAVNNISTLAINISTFMKLQGRSKSYGGYGFGCTTFYSIYP